MRRPDPEPAAGPVTPGQAILDASGVGPGGITRVLTELVRHWPAGRLDLVAVPSSWEPPTGHRADVRIVSRQRPSRAGTISEAARTLRRITAAAPPQTPIVSLSPSLAVLGSRRPATTIVHDLAFRLWPHGLPASVRAYRQVSYRAAIRRSDQLLCVSARTRHDLWGLYGVTADRTQVWQPGNDPADGTGPLPGAVAELRRRGAPFLVVAGHAAHKGAELAIDALPSLPGFTLVILTGGAHIEAFADAAAASAATERILLLGRVSDAEYAATVAAAAALLMPSHFEGYGLPAAEACRLGTPVVISPDPALHESTAGAAVRMATWTAPALVEAVTVIASGGGPAGTAAREAGRSWSAATAELVAILSGRRSPGDLPSAATVEL